MLPQSATSQQMNFNELWHISMDWPKCETIGIGLKASDSLRVVLEKVLKKKALPWEPSFYRIFYFQDFEGLMFREMEFSKKLSDYPKLFEGGAPKLLYMRYSQTCTNGPVSHPESAGNVISQPQPVAATSDATTLLSPSLLSPSSPAKRPRLSADADADADAATTAQDDDGEEIVEVILNAGYLSKADLVCPYSGVVYKAAMRNRARGKNSCSHHLDKASLETMWHIRSKDNSRKSVVCPSFGCDGRWTKKGSVLDKAFQQRVEDAVEYYAKQNISPAQGGVGGRAAPEIIDLE